MAGEGDPCQDGGGGGIYFLCCQRTTQWKRNNLIEISAWCRARVHGSNGNGLKQSPRFLNIDWLRYGWNIAGQWILPWLWLFGEGSRRLLKGVDCVTQ